MIRWTAGVCVLLVGPALVAADDWPQWRGPQRGGVSREQGLLRQWPAGGPKLLWKTADLGGGYSAPAVVRGRIYLLGTQGNDEVVLALNEKDGSRVWSQRLGPVGKNAGLQFPGPRSTPTVDGDLLYALGSDGDLLCLDTDKGQVVWTKHLRTDFGGLPGNWAYAESPLVDGDQVVVAPGGKDASLVALHKRTGVVVWKAPNKDGDKAAYASAVVADAGGVRHYVQFLSGGLVGVEARTGKLLWRSTATANKSANIPTPVVHGDGVFSVSGYGVGGGLLKLTADNGGVKATPVYAVKDLASQIGGVVFVEGFLYGIGTSQLMCVEFATGQVKWKEACVGPGSVCYADGRLYVRGEKGEVALVESNPNACLIKSRFDPPRGKQKAWPPPVIANGCLYLRDFETLLCYDVRGR